MLQAFKAYIAKEKLFLPGQRILLAISGGIDSVAMAELFFRAKVPFGIAHCNFQLRDEDSDKDEVFVKDLARKFKVPLYCKRFFTTDYADEHRLSTQMAARELRYKWFEEIREKEKFDYIATAHHLDDQAETFFINMMRSTGIAGFHGILPKQGKVVRPLLFASREHIVLFVKTNHLIYREDRSNQETKYLRNKIRHELIPVLSEMNPDFKKILTENIFRIREAERIFRESVENMRNLIVIKEKDRILLSLKELMKLDPRATYLYEFLSPFGFKFAVVSDITRALEEEPGRQFFSPTHRVIKDRNNLIITHVKPGTRINIDTNEYTIPDHTSCLEEPIPLTLKIIPKSQEFQIDPSPSTANLDLHKLTYPLKIRKWRSGDHFYPFGRNHKKKLSDFFTDQKFSIADKENCWLLCSGEKIVWIAGHRIDNRFRVTPKTKEVLQIRWLK